MPTNEARKVDSWDEEVTDVAPKQVDSWDEEVVDEPVKKKVTPSPSQTQSSSNGLNLLSGVIPSGKALLTGQKEESAPTEQKQIDLTNAPIAEDESTRTDKFIRKPIDKKKVDEIYTLSKQNESLVDEFAKSHFVLDNLSQSEAIKQLNDLYAKREQAKDPQTAQAIDTQIEVIKSQPVEKQPSIQEAVLQNAQKYGSQPQDFNRPEIPMNPLTPNQILERNGMKTANTVGELHDRYIESATKLNELRPELDKTAAELDAFKKDARTADFKTDKSGNKTLEGLADIPEAFGHGFGGTMKSIEQGFVNLLGDKQDRIDYAKKRYLEDNILYPTRTKGMATSGSEMVGGVAPYVISTAVLPQTALLGHVIINGLTMGASGYGNGYYEMFAKQKQQGASDEESDAIAMQNAKFEGAKETAIGASLPFMGGAGSKLFLAPAEKSAMKQFLATQGVIIPTFTAGKLASNVYQKYGLGEKDVNLGDGLAETAENGLILGAMMEFAHKAPTKLKELYRANLSEQYPSIQQSVDKAVKDGVMDASQGYAFTEKLKRDFAVFNAMPKDITTEQKLAIEPEVKQIIELSSREPSAVESPEVTKDKIVQLQKQVAEKLGTPLTEKELEEKVSLKKKLSNENITKDEKLLIESKLKHFDAREDTAKENETKLAEEKKVAEAETPTNVGVEEGSGGVGGDVGRKPIGDGKFVRYNPDDVLPLLPDYKPTNTGAVEDYVNQVVPNDASVEAYKTVPLDAIQTSEKIESKDRKAIDKIKEGIKNGDDIPPLVLDFSPVIKNGESYKFGLMDGHHRYIAYKELGIKEVPAAIVTSREHYTFETNDTNVKTLFGQSLKETTKAETTTPKGNTSNVGGDVDFAKRKKEMQTEYDKLQKERFALAKERDEIIGGGEKYRTWGKKQTDEKINEIRGKQKEIDEKQTALQKELKVIEAKEKGSVELFDHYNSGTGSPNTIIYDIKNNKLLERENIVRGKTKDISIEDAARNKFASTLRGRNEREINEAYTDKVKAKYEAEINEEIAKYKPVEQSLKETTQEGSGGVGGDVGATTKALEEVAKKKPNASITFINKQGYEQKVNLNDTYEFTQPEEAGLKGETIKGFRNQNNTGIIPFSEVAEAYHKAKADGSNPELVKAVEQLLGKEQAPISKSKTTETVSKDGSGVGGDNPALKEIGVEIKKDGTSEGFYQVYKDGKFVGLLGATSFEQARNKGQHFDEGLMSDILTRMGIEHSKAERNIQGENEFLTIRIKNSKAVEQSLKETTKAETPTKTSTQEDVLKPFADIINESNSFEEAFDKVRAIKDVPQETADAFSQKYATEQGTSPQQAFRKFYDEVKSQKSATTETGKSGSGDIEIAKRVNNLGEFDNEIRGVTNQRRIPNEIKERYIEALRTLAINKEIGIDHPQAKRYESVYDILDANEKKKEPNKKFNKEDTFSEKSKSYFTPHELTPNDGESFDDAQKRAEKHFGMKSPYPIELIKEAKEIFSGFSYASEGFNDYVYERMQESTKKPTETSIFDKYDLSTLENKPSERKKVIEQAVAEIKQSAPEKAERVREIMTNFDKLKTKLQGLDERVTKIKIEC